MEFKHQTVMRKELCAALRARPGDLVIDATAGGGGHTRELVKAVGERGRVIAIDRDPQAVMYLRSLGMAAEIHQLDFSQLASLQLAAGCVRGICADLGVSSPQLDDSKRGFSFLSEAPLDMRMSQSGESAADIIARASELELVEIFQQGEEPKAKKLARAIVEERGKREFQSCRDLAEFVVKVLAYRGSRRHPATRVFQALRIAVNGELDQLRVFLGSAWALVAEGGTLAVISFHSLEDRIVKQFFVDKARPKALSKYHARPKPSGEIVKPFPGYPTEEEVEVNPRARSAKLRVLRKV